jgi:DNA repair exonuclease SbcCD ATPase subunit
MANRNLTPSELEALFRPLMADVRAKLTQLSKGDAELLWALRRKLSKDLTYDERSKPGERAKLKASLRRKQGNKCPGCSKELPEKYAVLDRVEAMKGHTAENTRLICPACDTKFQ